MSEYVDPTQTLISFLHSLFSIAHTHGTDRLFVYISQQLVLGIVDKHPSVERSTF